MGDFSDHKSRSTCLGSSVTYVEAVTFSKPDLRLVSDLLESGEVFLHDGLHLAIPIVYTFYEKFTVRIQDEVPAEARAALLNVLKHSPQKIASCFSNQNTLKKLSKKNTILKKCKKCKCKSVKSYT